MKMQLKKVLKMASLFLVVTLLFNLSSVNTLSAASNTDKKVLVSKTSTSEYDKFKEFNRESVDSLIKKGYTKEEIEFRKNFDYPTELKKNVEKRAELDNDALNEMGYTNEQIEIIRNYTGTEEQMYALAATLNLSTYILSHGQSDSSSYAVLRTEFTWTTCPMFIATDALAASWTEGMYLMVDDSQTYARLKYGTTTKSATCYRAGNSGGYIKFPMTIQQGAKWCKSGEFSYKIAKQARVKEIATEAAYGHTQLQLNPTVTFGVNSSGVAAAGISFSYGCFTQADTSSDYIGNM